MNSLNNKRSRIDFSELCRLDPSFCSLSNENSEIILHEILHSPVLSSLGDALVNYAYMVARVRVIPGSSVSIKVWDYSLSEAMNHSFLKKFVRKKKTKGNVGDSVEGLLAFAHFTGLIPLEEQIKILEAELREIHFQDLLKEKAQEKTLAAFAFKALIIIVEERLKSVFPDLK